jgi:hypothetical protein
LANPTFSTAHIRNAETYPIVPINSRFVATDLILPRGLLVTVVSEDGNFAVVRFGYKAKVYQAVVPQSNLMIDFRTLFKK